MKKTLLSRINRGLACIAITATTLVFSNTLFAQAASGPTVDEAFARELKLVEGLKVYNQNLQDQLEAQRAAGAEIEKSIVDSQGLEPQIVPLLSKMLVALERFIDTDLPFHQEVRREGLDRVKELMVDSSVQTADRFRSIMDLYTIEIEYGNEYEAYSSTIDIEGTETPVDTLRIGRLALYYQTKDHKSSGMWDRATKTWTALPDSQNRQIRTAIKVARKTVAPELLNLPITAPEGV